MQDYLQIGVIVKPQGVRGEVKVQPMTDDKMRFKKLKQVIIDGATCKVLSAKIMPDAVILALEGVFDRDEAELLRGKAIFVDRQNAVKLEKGNYFIVDIIGSTLVTDLKREVGVITDVTTARTDIFTVKCTDGRILRFPFLKDLLIDVDVVNKIVTVFDKRLDEVSCYED